MSVLGNRWSSALGTHHRDYECHQGTARDPAFELSRERVGDDELVAIRSLRLDSRAPAVIGIRVGGSGALISVADSQALELVLPVRYRRSHSAWVNVDSLWSKSESD